MGHSSIYTYKAGAVRWLTYGLHEVKTPVAAPTLPMVYHLLGTYLAAVQHIVRRPESHVPRMSPKEATKEDAERDAQRARNDKAKAQRASGELAGAELQWRPG